MEQRKQRNKGGQNDNKNKKTHKQTDDVKNAPTIAPPPPTENVPAANIVLPASGEVLGITEPVDQKYAKRKIVSNKEKYETEMVNEDNEQMLAADFSKLLQNPQSIGGHFQFSNEKQWFSGTAETEMTSKLFQEYFNLNLSLLNESILTIPFYKRLDLDPNLFSEREIEEMNRKAEKMAGKYRKNVDANRNNNQKFTGQVEKISNNILEILKVRESPGEQVVDEIAINRATTEPEVNEVAEFNPLTTESYVAKPQRTVQKTSPPQVQFVPKKESPLQQNKQAIEEHDDDLDEILKNPEHLAIPPPEIVQPAPVVAVDTIEVSCERVKSPVKEQPMEESPKQEEAEDIQKWLDDVLND